MQSNTIMRSDAGSAIASKITGLIVAVVVLGAVLVPLVNGLADDMGGGGSGGSGGGGSVSGSIDLPNYPYTVEAMVYSDYNGWIATDNMAIESRVREVANPVWADNGEDYVPMNGDVYGHCVLYFSSNPGSGLGLGRVYLGMDYQEWITEPYDPKWTISFPEMIDGVGICYDWSLTANGDVTVVYKLRGQSSPTTETFKANYLWYDSNDGDGNYQDLGGFYSSSYPEGFSVSIGSYVGLTGTYHEEYTPPIPLGPSMSMDWPYTYLGQIGQGTEVTIQFWGYDWDSIDWTNPQEPPIIKRTATVNLAEDGVLEDQGNGSYWVNTGFVLPATYKVNGTYQDTVLTAQQLYDDGYPIWTMEYGAEIDENTQWVSNMIGQVGAPIYRYDDNTDTYVPTGQTVKATDFAITLSNGVGFGLYDPLNDPNEEVAVLWTGDISLGNVTVTNYDPLFFIRASMDAQYTYMPDENYVFRNSNTDGVVASFIEDDNGGFLMPNWETMPFNVEIPSQFIHVLSIEMDSGNSFEIVSNTVDNICYVQGQPNYYDGWVYWWPSPMNDGYGSDQIPSYIGSMDGYVIPMSMDFRQVQIQSSGEKTNGGPCHFRQADSSTSTAIYRVSTGSTGLTQYLSTGWDDETWWDAYNYAPVMIGDGWFVQLNDRTHQLQFVSGSDYDQSLDDGMMKFDFDHAEINGTTVTICPYDGEGDPFTVEGLMIYSWYEGEYVINFDEIYDKYSPNMADDNVFYSFVYTYANGSNLARYLCVAGTLDDNKVTLLAETSADEPLTEYGESAEYDLNNGKIQSVSLELNGNTETFDWNGWQIGQVVFYVPMTIDEGGSSEGGSSVLGTLLKTIPIFVGVAIILAIVGMFYTKDQFI